MKEKKFTLPVLLQGQAGAQLSITVAMWASIFPERVKAERPVALSPFVLFPPIAQKPKAPDAAGGGGE
jgi:hypothetical protein